MDAIRIDRRADQENAAEPFGLSANYQRIWANQVTGAGQEAEILAFMPDLSTFTPLQNDRGEFYFMSGYDDPGGSAPL